jgi:hypothetical protein
MVKGIWILSFLLLSSCSSTTTIFIPAHAENACLPNAIGFKDAYEVRVLLQEKRWAKIFIADEHAYCVFLLGDTVWVYDNINGSRPTNIRTEDKEDVNILLTWLFPHHRDMKGHFIQE